MSAINTADGRHRGNTTEPPRKSNKRKQEERTINCKNLLARQEAQDTSLLLLFLFFSKVYQLCA